MFRQFEEFSASKIWVVVDSSEASEDEIVTCMVWLGEVGDSSEASEDEIDTGLVWLGVEQVEIWAFKFWFEEVEEAFKLAFNSEFVCKLESVFLPTISVFSPLDYSSVSSPLELKPFQLSSSPF